VFVPLVIKIYSR